MVFYYLKNRLSIRRGWEERKEVAKRKIKSKIDLEWGISISFNMRSYTNIAISELTESDKIQAAMIK